MKRGTHVVRLIWAFAAVAAYLMMIPRTASAAENDWMSAAFSNSSSSTAGLSSIFGSSYGASGRASVAFPKRYSAGQIIISFADRRLYHVTKRGRAVSYPITVPRKQSRWSGTHRISRKAVNPKWTPTRLMRKENPRLPAYVPGGHKRNPLGVRALYLGSTLYRIHGTDAPWTIGKAVSKGCIRMFNADVVELYKRVRVGTRVMVTYNRYQS